MCETRTFNSRDEIPNQTIWIDENENCRIACLDSYLLIESPKDGPTVGSFIILPYALWPYGKKMEKVNTLLLSDQSSPHQLEHHNTKSLVFSGDYQDVTFGDLRPGDLFMRQGEQKCLKKCLKVYLCGWHTAVDLQTGHLEQPQIWDDEIVYAVKQPDELNSNQKEHPSDT